MTGDTVGVGRSGRRACGGVWLAACVALATAACGDDDGPGDGAPDDGGGPADAGQDASPGDASSDSGVDAGPPPEVRVSYRDGTVVGRTVDGVHSFLGLPYAAPPVGDLRFRPPAPPAPWTAPRDASELGSQCPQINLVAASTTVQGEEDCLFVNVFTPDVAPESPLPVLVWIHGGAFVFGSGGTGPRALARGSRTVVVTLNYRLDVLGMLAHPALTEEGDGTSGNYAFLDQRAALEWVRDNIGAFGGDADQVTLAGQSAGSYSVAVHSVSPGSAGLFRRAILQSGPPHLLTLPTLAEAEARGGAVAERVGCTDPASVATCLREAPVDALVVIADLLSSPGGLFFQPEVPVFPPNVDGNVVPVDPAEAFAAGAVADATYMLGTTRDEATLFQQIDFLSTPVADDAELHAALARTWPEDADALAAHYPVARYDDANAALTALMDDFFSCMTRRVTRSLSDGGMTTWLYAFEGVPEGLLVDTYHLGAYHTADLVFLFDQRTGLPGHVPDGGEDLVAAMHGYWTRFVATGDPNGGDAPEWPRYETATDQHMRLASPPEAGEGFRRDACDFWDTLGPR